MKAIKKKLVLIVFLSAVFLLGMSSRLPQQDNGYKIGEFAADFELPDVSGDKVSMGMIRYSNAKGFIIVFTCNHCPFSRKYEERIIALSKKYEPLGFPLSTSLYLFALSTLLDARRLVLNAVVAVCFSASLYFLFTLVLKSNLPIGAIFS